MSFTYVRRENGWFLKISSVRELRQYVEAVENPNAAEAFRDFMTSKDYAGENGIREGREHSKSALAYVSYMHMLARPLNIVQAIEEVLDQKIQMQLSCLRKGYSVYINRKGGWIYGEKDYTDWFASDSPTAFPEKNEGFTVKKFPLGNHFYVFCNDKQVQSGDTVKWNTYEEAQAYIEKLTANVKS